MFRIKRALYNGLSKSAPQFSSGTCLSNGNLLQFLNSLNGDSHLKETILGRSHFHPSGFYRLILDIQEDGTVTRLHFWRKSPEMIYYPHTHGWDFTSQVLTGSLAETIYSETDEQFANKFSKFINDNQQTHGKCYLDEGSVTNLTETRKMVHKTGTTYSRKGTEIHLARPLEDRTLTLIQQEPLKYTSYLYRSADLEGDFCTQGDFRVLTSDELEETVAFVNSNWDQIKYNLTKNQVGLVAPFRRKEPSLLCAPSREITEITYPPVSSSEMLGPIRYSFRQTDSCSIGSNKPTGGLPGENACGRRF